MRKICNGADPYTYICMRANILVSWFWLVRIEPIFEDKKINTVHDGQLGELTLVFSVYLPSLYQALLIMIPMRRFFPYS